MANAIYLADEEIYSLWLVDIFYITMTQLAVHTPTFELKIKTFKIRAQATCINQ